jgi:hypothetical protein
MRVGGPGTPDPGLDATGDDQPRLPRGKDMDGHQLGTLGYGAFRGDLFVHGVSAQDVGQGDLGDCYFLSALAAVANTHPERIRDAVKQNADGTYAVTLFDRAKGGALTPTPVTVDPRFPVGEDGQQKFGKGLETGASGQELWPALFEKAFARLSGGYQTINQGGYGDQAIEAVTGAPADKVTLRDMSSDALWKKISDATATKRPMVTSTPTTRELNKRAGGTAPKDLIEGHYYALLSCFDRGGTRMVRLYTPLVDDGPEAVTTPSPLQNAKRTVEIPFDEWKKLFDDVDIGTA